MSRESIYFEQIHCKRCGCLFEKRGWNNVYCPDCKGPHRNERVMANYWKKRGGKSGTRKGTEWSDYHRFQFYMDKTWMSALCPICGKHMSVDRCSESDPDLRQYQPASAATWEPWK